MPASAALPDRGRRPDFSTALLVAAYLLFAPSPFLLLPLCLLLLFSRPASLWEWAWLVLAGLGTGLTIVGLPAERLPERLTAAGAVTAGALFAVQAFLGISGRAFSRALLALGVAALAVLGWSLTSGMTAAQLDAVLTADLASMVDRMFLAGAPEQLAAARRFAEITVYLFPGFLALQGLAGLMLAWAWYGRIARRPFGPAAGRFRDFRFNDHLIWGAIFTLALALLPVPGSIARGAHNLLVFWLGIYAGRGAAVVVTAVAGWPFPGKILLVTLSFLALPFAAGGTVALGLADTWLDFRTRRVSAAGGSDADGSDSP
ncbi:MAG: DUF2232 domain-containing protein [Gemmatimonadales bacterium]